MREEAQAAELGRGLVAFGVLFEVLAIGGGFERYGRLGLASALVGIAAQTQGETGTIYEHQAVVLMEEVLRALTEKGFVKCSAVVTNLKPARDRARPDGALRALVSLRPQTFGTASFGQAGRGAISQRWAARPTRATWRARSPRRRARQPARRRAPAWPAAARRRRGSLRRCRPARPSGRRRVLPRAAAPRRRAAGRWPAPPPPSHASCRRRRSSRRRAGSAAPCCCGRSRRSSARLPRRCPCLRFGTRFGRPRGRPRI